MLRKHATAIARINADAEIKDAVIDYFNLPPCAYLTPALYQRGLGQADLVLALLRVRGTRELVVRARSHVEALIGHPITVGPSCLLAYPVNGKPRARRQRTVAERRIVSVAAENPRSPNTAASRRWCEFKVGRTVESLRAHGVTKRDIRRATRMGWIKFEEPAHA